MATISFDAGASAYDRIAGRWSRLYIPTLLAGASIAAGQRVLDVATGTGEAAVLAASLVGPSGRVLAVDISLPMLHLAHAKAAGRPIALAAMDGQVLACRDRSFDAVICQLGLMFFPDLSRGLVEFRRVLRPRGRVAVCVWSTPERVPMFGILSEALSRHLPAQRELLHLSFSLADPRRLERVLAGAGFHDVRVSGETRKIVFESFKEYWEPVEAGGGRSGQVYRGLSEGTRQAVREEVGQRLSQFESDGRLVMEAEALFGLASG
ncbi:MAG: methyltransferase domain-containing protein [candidate division NC10 bacterium]|nr:methyltransferase domain-containing protein [candidate division NC10 bacterium]